MISLQQLQQAQDEAKRTGKRLGATLARLGYVKDRTSPSSSPSSTACRRST